MNNVAIKFGDKSYETLINDNSINLEDELLKVFQSTSQCDFNVVSFNAQSIPAHFRDISLTFCGSIINKIHAIIVCETNITPITDTTSYNLPGYRSIRKDRHLSGRASGGVLIYLRDDILYDVLITSNGQAGLPEYVFIKVYYLGFTILLGALYIAPNVYIHPESIPFQNVQNICDRDLVMGDLNVCQSKSGLRKRQLDSIINSAALNILPIDSSGTNHQPNKKSSIIDLTITSDVSSISKYGKMSACYSYHDLVYASLAIQAKPDVINSQVTLLPTCIENFKKQSIEEKIIRSMRLKHKSQYNISRCNIHLQKYQELNKLWRRHEQSYARRRKCKIIIDCNNRVKLWIGFVETTKERRKNILSAYLAKFKP